MSVLVSSSFTQLQHSGRKTCTSTVNTQFRITNGRQTVLVGPILRRFAHDMPSQGKQGSAKARPTPAIPRPSASVIVVNSQNEILLVHRNPKSNSFANAHVGSSQGPSRKRQMLTLSHRCSLVGTTTRSRMASTGCRTPRSGSCSRNLGSFSSTRRPGSFLATASWTAPERTSMRRNACSATS